jgi:DeoR family ulaG and ulaABCDEF operon transcriptional repressor
MTEAQRHQILLDLLAQTGFVTVEQVISRLGISPATARRDINKLDESGKLKKSATARKPSASSARAGRR